MLKDILKGAKSYLTETKARLEKGQKRLRRGIIETAKELPGAWKETTEEFKWLPKKARPIAKKARGYLEESAPIKIKWPGEKGKGALALGGKTIGIAAPILSMKEVGMTTVGKEIIKSGIPDRIDIKFLEPNIPLPGEYTPKGEYSYISKGIKKRPLIEITEKFMGAKTSPQAQTDTLVHEIGHHVHALTPKATKLTSEGFARMFERSVSYPKEGGIDARFVRNGLKKVIRISKVSKFLGSFANYLLKLWK